MSNFKHGRLIMSNIKLAGVIALKQWYVITHPCLNFNLIQVINEVIWHILNQYNRDVFINGNCEHCNVLESLLLT